MSNASDFIIENGVLKRFIGTDTHVTVPDGVTVISNYAFQRYPPICSVQLPNGITQIGDYAFQDCTALEEINIPSTVESVGAEAFRNCRQLKKLTFTGKPKKIGVSLYFLLNSLPAPPLLWFDASYRKDVGAARKANRVLKENCPR